MNEAEQRRRLAAKRSRDRRDSDVAVELYAAVVWGLPLADLSKPASVRRVGGATIFDWQANDSLPPAR